MRYRALIRLVVLAVICVALVVSFGIGVVSAADSAAPTVRINTPVFRYNVPLSYTNRAGAVISLGLFDAYNYYGGLTYSWEPDPYEKIDFEHTAYRVSLHQWFPWSYYQGAYDEYQEIFVAFHWASSPHHTSFDILSLQTDHEWVCPDCPTQVKVEPYTFVHYLDTTTGVWEYAYTPLRGGKTQWSKMFLIIRDPSLGVPPTPIPGS